MKIENRILANAIAKPVCNTIGDCFADGVFDIERIAKEKSVAKIKNGLKQAKIDVQYAKTYDDFDATDKFMLGKCVKAIDRAIADPSSKNIIAARWACEKARASRDGGSPQRAFWNSSVAVKNYREPKADEAKIMQGLPKGQLTGRGAEVFESPVNEIRFEIEYPGDMDLKKVESAVRAKGFKIYREPFHSAFRRKDNWLVDVLIPKNLYKQYIKNSSTAEPVAGIAKNMDVAKADKLENRIVAVYLDLDKFKREISSEKGSSRTCRAIEDAIVCLKQAARRVIDMVVVNTANEKARA